MAVTIPELLDPRASAVLLMECQNGIIGSGSGRLNTLAEAVERHGTVAQMRRVVEAARRRKVPIFYLTVSRRADSAGAATNCLLLALGRKGTPLLPGSPQQAVVAELTPQDGDFVVNRMHGITPFHGTELDQLLRNLGVRTLLAMGVSVNVGITGLTMEAVNAGYQVVIPRDAVAGTPDDYVEAVLQNTLRLLATITTVDEIVAAWPVENHG
jgi:nicotinamidase-related amidase